MMHPDTEVRFIDDEVGYGVVAKKFIPMGTVTWVQDPLDQSFTTEEVKDMHPQIQKMIDKYAFRNSNGNYVLCWDQAKYVNHSFRSNCLSTAYDFEVAIRDIEPGEQLTDDYGYLNIEEPFKARSEGTARNTVFPDDLLKYYKVWDDQIAIAFKDFKTVSQPLKDLIPPSVRKLIQEKLENKEQLDSILNLYFEEK